MANYNVLKNAIQNNYDWDNGENKIEGPDVEQCLLALIDSLGANYQYAGIAKLTPTQTDPGTPDQNVFYICAEAGTYTNFGGLVVEDGEVAILKYNGTWSKDTSGAATSEQVDGKLFYSATKTLQANEYRVIITSGVPVLNSPQLGRVKVTGLEWGIIAFLNSSWQSQADVNFTDGEEVGFTIPANCPYIIVYNKNGVPVESATNVQIEVIQGGLRSLILYVDGRVDDINVRIPFTDISAKFPTGGTGGTDIYTGTNARAKIEASQRRQGYIIMYKSAIGLVLEQYVGSVLTTEEWLYGTWYRLDETDIVNLNSWYGKSDAYASVSAAINNVPAYCRRGGIIIRFQLSSGWVTMQLNASSWTTVLSSWQTIAVDIDPSLFLDTRYQLSRLIFSGGDFAQGYFNTPTTIADNANRVCNKNKIKVYKGDLICLESYDFVFNAVVYDNAFANVLQSRDYGYYPLLIEQDGYINIQLYNRGSASTPITPEQVAGKFQIQRGFSRAFQNNFMESNKSSDLVLGYINDAGNIASHDKRFVNWKRLPVKKGDLVYSTNPDVQILIHEYGNNGAHITSSGTYYLSRPVYSGSPGICGAYAVKNDGFIMCQCAVLSAPETIDLSLYGNAITVIHVPKNNTKGISCGVKPITPRSPKRGKDIPLPSNYGRFMQSGTIIGDNLWMQIDDYAQQPDSKKIIVVNKESGNLVKSIVCPFHGSISYNENNDCLLMNDVDNIYLFFSPDNLPAEISTSDADVTIPIDTSYKAYCWGENERTLYEVMAYDGTDGTGLGTAYNWRIRKMILGVDVNGNYDGTISEALVYSGDVLEGIDTFHGSFDGNVNWVQDLDYDGFLYFCVGTAGSNFLVIDLDDNNKTFTIVGNYIGHYYDSSMNEIALEPELFALDGGNVYCGARNYGQGVYYLKKYSR